MYNQESFIFHEAVLRLLIFDSFCQSAFQVSLFLEYLTSDKSVSRKNLCHVPKSYTGTKTFILPGCASSCPSQSSSDPPSTRGWPTFFCLHVSSLAFFLFELLKTTLPISRTSPHLPHARFALVRSVTPSICVCFCVCFWLCVYCPGGCGLVLQELPHRHLQLWPWRRLRVPVHLHCCIRTQMLSAGGHHTLEIALSLSWVGTQTQQTQSQTMWKNTPFYLPMVLFRPCFPILSS